MATELVDMSKKAVSGFMPSMRPFGPSATASTSAGTGREVNTTSLASATWRGELAQTAPLARNGSGAARLRSWAVGWWPAVCRLAARPIPLMPRPVKPDRMRVPVVERREARGGPGGGRGDRPRGAAVDGDGGVIAAGAAGQDDCRAACRRQRGLGPNA